MRFKLTNQTVGPVLLVVLLVLCLWLALERKLTLYIHPRYVWFTVVLCALALAAVVAKAILPDASDGHEINDQHQHETQTSTTSKIVLCLCIVFCAALIVVRPASLTSSAAEQRGINSASLDIATTKLDLSDSSTDYSRFSLKEWASLLSASTDASQFAGKQVQASGFVSPSPDDNPDVFYVSRFVVTCCAIDARPVGIPVYKEDWRQQLQPDKWVAVRGTFVQHENGEPALVLQTSSLETIEEPKDPYVY